MPYKDPEKQKEYQREWQRMKKAGEYNKPTIRTLNPEDIQTAKGLLELLSQTIADVQSTESDTLIKARLIGYLISIGLKAVETAGLESRLSSLEEVLKGRRKSG